MRKLISLLCLLLWGQLAFCQEPTLEETLNWIKTKIEMYPSCGKPCYIAHVSFDLNEKTIHLTYHSDWGNAVEYLFSLKKINPASFKYEKQFLFSFNTYGNDVTHIDYDRAKNETTSRNDGVVYLVFDDASFLKEDLQQRLTKAFQKVIVLSGGTKEAY